MPGRRGVGVDKIWMIFFVPGVELKNQATRRVDPIISITVLMIRQRVCRQQFTVPTATRPNVAYRNQGLSFDGRSHAQ